MKNTLPKFVAAALLTTAVACGPGVETPTGTPNGPVFSVQARATGNITAAGELRAALAWTVYSDELLACLDDIEVEGILTFETDEDYFTARAIQSCLTFSERGSSEMASVPFEASFPASLSIPLHELPSTSVLSGDAGARLGIAEVLVYEDVDGDGVFRETPRGAMAFVDLVRGTSWVAHEEDEEASFIVYREGALSSIWKAYRAIYGCPDPAPGFSTVTLTATDVDFGCVVDQGVVPVEMRDGLESLGCAPDLAGDAPVRADLVDGYPVDAVAYCDPIDGYADLVFSTNPESVCPSFGVYSLVGCDTSSMEACQATYYDLLGDEPSWWPCDYGNGEVIHFYASEMNDGAVTIATDELFTLTMGSTLAQLDPARLRIFVGMPGGSSVELSGVVDDSNDNGRWNAGEAIRVSEPTNVFDEGATPGAYPITVTYDEVHVGMFQQWYWPDLPTPGAPVLDIVVADAEDVIDDIDDELFTFHYVGAEADAPAYALADLRVSGYLGGEYPLSDLDRLRAPGEAAFRLAQDENGDGLFGLGDTVVFRVGDSPEDQSFSALVQDFTPVVYGLSLSAPVAFNVHEIIVRLDDSISFE